MKHQSDLTKRVNILSIQTGQAFALCYNKMPNPNLLAELEKLIAAGVNINAVNRRGISLLQCVYMFCKEDAEDIVEGILFDNNSNYTNAIVDKKFLNHLLKHNDAELLYLIMQSFSTCNPVAVEITENFCRQLQAKIKKNVDFIANLVGIPSAVNTLYRNDDSSQNKINNLLDLANYGYSKACALQKYMLLSYAGIQDNNRAYLLPKAPKHKIANNLFNLIRIK